MTIKQSHIPKDSIIHLWIESLSITELPLSYIMFSGLSAVGALLKRNVWIDQLKWQVYPNLSLLLVGPSGIGKDITIHRVRSYLSKVNHLPIIGGQTMEYIKSSLFDLGDPAAAYLPTPELTAFLGGKDYQKSMVQELTDLLSTGDEIDISLRSTGRRILKRPTITMHAGSTKEWLHKAMPEGALDGGLFPRFLILCEQYNSKHIPLIKYSNLRDETFRAEKAQAEFISRSLQIITRFEAQPQEILLLDDAQDLYATWYHNRFSYFSKAVAPYANRARDQVLRMALAMAVTRNHNYIEAVDVQFGIDGMAYVASSIDSAVKPSTGEAEVAKLILDLLPETLPNILRALYKYHSRKMILEAHQLLVESGQIVADANHVYTRR